jgi:MFS family permease
MVGKFSTVQVLVIAAAGALLGKALEFNEHAYRVLVPLACVVGAGAVWFFAGVRVRGRRAMLAEEQRLASSGKPWQGPGIVWRVLRKDPWFARFQTCMFILGVSNLMLAPVLVISLRDQFGLGYLGVLITSTIPYVTMVLAIPLWARLLDRAHVVKFRSIHSWAFVVSTTVILIASMTHRVELMYVGAVLQGLAFGGGTLAWNLGHTDFAPPSQTSEYMAAHVTLNGVRGLLAPFVAVLGIYQPALAMGATPGQAMSLVCAVTLALAVAGAVGFVLLRRQMGAMLAQVRRG